MAQPSSDMLKALNLLGLTPEAGPVEIRAAWKAMIKSYHPDRVSGDKRAANERLAEINVAFEQTSKWTADMAQAFRAERTKAKAQAAQALRQAERRAAETARQRAEAARQRAAGRKLLEEAARKRATELERYEARKREQRAVRSHRPSATEGKAEARFLASLENLAIRVPVRELGFA